MTVSCKCSIRAPVPGYSLSRDLIVIGDDVDEDGRIDNHDARPLVCCSKNEHFLNPPMFTFCSDSPSVMQKLRKDCLTSKEFMFAYGCAPHAIHNLCMDLIKHFPAVTIVLKQSLCICKSNYLISCAWRSTRRHTFSFCSRRQDGELCTTLPSKRVQSRQLALRCLAR